MPENLCVHLIMSSAYNTLYSDDLNKRFNALIQCALHKTTCRVPDVCPKHTPTKITLDVVPIYVVFVLQNEVILIENIIISVTLCI